MTILSLNSVENINTACLNREKLNIYYTLYIDNNKKIIS